jgi:hypothetical protein
MIFLGANTNLSLNIEHGRAGADWAAMKEVKKTDRSRPARKSVSEEEGIV